MNVKRAERLIERLKKWNVKKDKIMFDMNRWNEEVRHAENDLLDNKLYPEGSRCRKEIGKELAHCKTACCLGGATEKFFRTKSAAKWLGLTDDQSDILFFPGVRSLDYDQIWGVESPIRLMGSHDLKYAIKALRRAIKLWGDPPKKKKAKHA
jgi:hypothetical protein